MKQPRLEPFDPERFAPDELSVARIDEDLCIGCTLCIAACPVDAIVGAAKAMHTVLASRCIGCELCLPPCPVDCIAMLPAGRLWTAEDRTRMRRHVQLRSQRLEHRAAPAVPAADAEKERRRVAVAAAFARARARRAGNAHGAE